MATKKISALTELTTPAGTEELIVNAGGTSKKIQIDNLPSSLADNSVTLAKMAGGTDGNLITYDASGDPAYVTTGTSGQVLTSGGTGVAPTFQTAAGGNSPYFYVDKTGSGRMTVSEDTMTKITLSDNEYDPDGVYDATTNYRFTVPSGKDGQYFFSAGVEGDTSTAQDVRAVAINIKKNGSVVNTPNFATYANGDLNAVTVSIAMILNLSAGDYVELWGSLDSVSNASTRNMEGFFTGFKIG